MHMKHTVKLLLSFTVLLVTVFANAQQPPFYDDIQKFKHEDSISFPPQHVILFVGSSSFTKWTDVQQYFPSYKIINRGFGGSELKDVIRYEKDVIFPYNPKQVVIYCGENDFAYSDTISVQTVVGRFITLFNDIRNRWANIPLAYVSMKPSLAREKLMPKYEEANKQIKTFLASQKKTVFIDVYHAMLKEDGKPITDLFVEDNLHMNAKGYAIWKKLIEPYLLK